MRVPKHTLTRIYATEPFDTTTASRICEERGLSLP
jgi:hypothetical protein